MLLKIAMELQDKQKSMPEQEQFASQLKMQRLRFQRFAALWKIVLEESLPELDIW